jgi:hypothetical protein
MPTKTMPWQFFDTVDILRAVLLSFGGNSRSHERQQSAAGASGRSPEQESAELTSFDHQVHHVSK